MTNAERLRRQAQSRREKMEAELALADTVEKLADAKQNLKAMAMKFGEAANARSPIVRTDILIEIKGVMDAVFAEAKAVVDAETGSVAKLKEVASG